MRNEEQNIEGSHVDCEEPNIGGEQRLMLAITLEGLNKTSMSVSRPSVARLFGRVLQALRGEWGGSQEELCFRAGLDRTYVSLLERGLRSPTIEVQLRLAGAMNITLIALMERVQAALEEGDVKK
jgi:DNA-binding XRE family transcriptional regulator